ncbi:O104 family O-antigen polymerase, partial [Escherichia coli]|nr:O104 family O-antigen polymerase [Escherichia coli]
EIYGNSQFAHLQGGFGTGLGFVFHIFLIMFSIYNLKDNYILRNLLFTAGLLMIIAPGNLNIMRFGQYFYISLIIALPLAIKSLKKEYSYNLLLKCLFFCLLFIFFQSQQSRNNYSYQSIFSDSFNSELFTPRSSDRTIINH